MDRAEVAAQLRDNRIRTLHDVDGGRGLVTVRGQLAQVHVGRHETPTTERLRAVIEAGEAERARRAALTPDQAALEAEIRREMGVSAPPTPLRRAPAVEATDDYPAHLGAQREATRDQDLGRDV